MTKINWKVRIKQKWFWLAIIPAAALLLQAIAAAFGFQLEVGETVDKLLEVVNTAFVVLVIVGVVVDPTTEGAADSEQALDYEAPKQNEVPTGRKGYPYE